MSDLQRLDRRVWWLVGGALLLSLAITAWDHWGRWHTPRLRQGRLPKAPRGATNANAERASPAVYTASLVAPKTAQARANAGLFGSESDVDA